MINKPYLIRTACSLIAIFFILLPCSTFAQAGMYQPGKIYVKLKPHKLLELRADNKGNIDVQHVRLFHDQGRNISVTKASQPFYRNSYAALKNVIELEFDSDAMVDYILQELELDENVEYAERIPLGQLTYSPNDTWYGSTLWHLFKINASQAWDISKGDAGIVVAVVDDAIDIDHADLSANIWRNSGEISGNGIDDDNNGYIDDINGWDFADEDNDPSPPSSTLDHGTHVAGIVSAATDNNIGIASIGFRTSVMACKSSKDGGSGITHALSGILYAADNGARVINMSWSAPPGATLKSVIDYAYAKGCILVAAAGNSGSMGTIYPAAYDNVIAVANTDNNDKKSSSSTYVTHVAVSAPGTNIYSCNVGSGYQYLSGTSMASPLVAGLCGLMLSVYPDVQQDDVLGCLQSTAVNIDGLNPAYAGMLGAGRVDAGAAVSCMQQFLTYAPTTQFTSNTTSITEGGSVQFTDQTNYGPAAWQWNFGDGSPISNLQHPLHFYSNTGSYTVTLTTSNANGADTHVEAAYIEVNPISVCDTAMNFNPTDPLSVYNTPTNNGLLAGHNGFLNEAYAEYFNSYAPYSLIAGATYLLFINDPGNSSSFLRFAVWDQVGGKPGTKIYSSDLLISQVYDPLNSVIQLDINFDPLIQIPGNFYIGLEVFYTNGEFLSLVTTKQGVVSTNTAWTKTHPLNTGEWHGFDVIYGDKYALAVMPHLAETEPTASFTQSLNTTCEDGFVTYNAGGSLNANSYFWDFPGGNPSSSTEISPTVLYSISGIYTTKLTVDGGCNQSEQTSIVQVDICTDIEEHLPSNSFNAYFSAQHRTLAVDFPHEQATSGTLKLFNILGELVEIVSVHPGTQNTFLNAQSLHAGIYVIKWSGVTKGSVQVAVY